MLPNALYTLKIGENTVFEIHMYGIMVAIGIFCCFLSIFLYCKKLGIPDSFVDFVFYNGVASIVFGFFSAALFQAVYNYIENPSRGFRLFGSGITFIGGLIGGALFFLVVYFLLRGRLKNRLSEVLSIIPCAILVAHAFGRVGCFFAGCCYGMETDSFLGVKFPYLPHPVHPTQLYEAAFLFLMFGICSYLLLRYRTRHNMSLYLFCYGIFRFLIEFVRDDARGEFLFGISPSQFWSILMIAGAFLVYYLEKKYVPLVRKEENA